MALRLAGEEFNVIQGLDQQGWPRLVQAADADPGMRVNQKGSGRILELQQNGALKGYIGNDGTWVIAAGGIDVQQPLKNTSASYDGAVGVADWLYVFPGVSVRAGAGLGGPTQVELSGTNQALHLLERTSHLPDADVNENYGHVYIYNSGAGTRQLVIKYKDAGTVYTGTVNLA